MEVRRWPRTLDSSPQLPKHDEAWLEALQTNKFGSPAKGSQIYWALLAESVLGVVNTGDYPNVLTSTVRAKTVTRITFLNR